MSQISLEELQERAQNLRQRVDLLYAKHAQAAALEPFEPDAVEVSVEDLAQDCQPTTLGGVSIAELDRAEAALVPFLTGDGSEDALDGGLVRGQEQVEKGRNIATSIQGQLRQACALENALRDEVETRLQAVREGDSNSAIFAAEQEVLLTEKLQLLILIAALLEAAKLCLLDVINLLDRAAALYRGAAVALNNTSLSLQLIVRDVFNLGQPLIERRNKRGQKIAGLRIGTDVEALLFGTPGRIVTATEIERFAVPLRKLEDARRAAVQAIRNADPLVLAALQTLLPICLALQALARLLMKDFLDSQEGLSDGKKGKKESGGQGLCW